MQVKRINGRRWRSDDGEFLFQRMPGEPGDPWAIFEVAMAWNGDAGENDGFGRDPAFSIRFDTLGHAINFAECTQKKRRRDNAG